MASSREGDIELPDYIKEGDFLTVGATAFQGRFCSIYTVILTCGSSLTSILLHSEVLWKGSGARVRIHHNQRA